MTWRIWGDFPTEFAEFKADHISLDDDGNLWLENSDTDGLKEDEPVACIASGCWNYFMRVEGN